MLDRILSIDTNFFLLINRLPHNFFLDNLNLFISAAGYFGIIFFLLALPMMIREEKKDKRFIVYLLISYLLVILFVNITLKKIVHRPRPHFALKTEVINVGTEDNGLKDFSFPSTHAAFAFAGAYILTREDRKKWEIWYLAAILIAFSRIYLGKHYPLDVISGGVIGSILGWLSINLGRSIPGPWDKKLK